MPDATCSIDGCERKRRCRGWCEGHYARWRKHGDPTAGRIIGDDLQRFWAHVDQSNECWNWTGSLNHYGYGQLDINDGGGKATRRNVRAHRYAYELLVGPVPAGLQLDHTCHNRKCVRPEHLRPITPKQNNENRAGANKNSGTGSRGIWRHPNGRWCAQVTHNRTKLHIGYFTTLEEAEAAVIAKRNELFSHNDKDKRET